MPEPWKVYSNENGEIYYCNTNTNQIINDHPLDDHYRKLVTEAKQKKNPSKATFLNKFEDPLIRAETDKKVKE